MLSNSFEDFVMTPIKCPPPKIVAVKRSLRSRSNKKNIMDEDELSIKDEFDFINDDDSLSSFDTKDLIEFERDEPLIDLSDAESSATENAKSTKDTISDKNAKNSSTLLSLLDLLEIGSVMRTKETAIMGSCAESDPSDNIPFTTKTSSSSSLQNIPVECPCACATSSGNTDKVSSVFPPLSIQPENSSIVKNCSHHSEELLSDKLQTLKLVESEINTDQRVCEGIDEKFIDSTLQNSHQCQSEKSEENFLSTSISFSCSDSNCSTSTCFCKDENSEKICENSVDNFAKEEKNLNFCHLNHHQNLQQQNSKDVNAQLKVQEIKSESSDTNNNRESVCNQNSHDKESSPSSRVTHEKNRELNESLKFLSPHTSQRKLPPKFYSSTNSLNQDCFEASSRLKRLEERFKGFSYTKKLLRSSKVFSKSEEILSSYGRAKEFKSCESLNSSGIQFPLTSTTLSENCLRQLTKEEDTDQNDYHKERIVSSNDEVSGKFEI
jgi:hypothetical protein